MSLNIEIEKDFHFEAAHFLPNVPPHHKCHPIHGHSYKVTIRAQGPVQEKYGWVMDLSDISEIFAPLQKMLDHSLLNKIQGLENPTSENIAHWIFDKLHSHLPLLSSVSVSSTHQLCVTVKKAELT